MRYAIAVEYNGSSFCGWQRQHHSVSVQQTIEEALARVADHPVTLVCAGRTDAGVHAFAQIAHFDTAVTRPDNAWTFGTNSHLPAAVAVRWAGPVADKFHARFDAIERRYRYTILNRPTRAGYGQEYCAWIRQPLDAEQMQRAAQYLVGEHDFSAFRSAECQAPHAVRTINQIKVARCEDLVTIDVTGNAFLHNMVRIITGSLIKVGYGDKPPSWIGHVLESGDRTQAGMTAAARGLCFRGVCYPAECGLPDFAGGGGDSNGLSNLLL